MYHNPVLHVVILSEIAAEDPRASACGNVDQDVRALRSAGQLGQVREVRLRVDKQLDGVRVHRAARVRHHAGHDPCPPVLERQRPPRPRHREEHEQLNIQIKDQQ